MAGRTTARGYGGQHRKLREQWRPIVESGAALCTRCQEPIDPEADWDLDHDDRDRRRYRGVSHASCNRSVGGRHGAEVVHAQRQLTIREW